MITRKEYEKYQKACRKLYEEGKRLREKFEKDCNLTDCEYGFLADAPVNEIFEGEAQIYPYEKIIRLYEAHK
jgi:ubiquitin